MTLVLTAMLWPHDGQEETLIEYEDTVLALIPKYGGSVLERVRRSRGTDGPFEVQIIELPDDAALESYLVDPVRVALADTHKKAIARTDVIRVDRVARES